MSNLDPSVYSLILPHYISEYSFLLLTNIHFLIALSETQTSLPVLFNEQNMVFKEMFLVWFRNDSTKLVLLKPQHYFFGYLRYLEHTLTDISTLLRDLLSNKSSNKHMITNMCEFLKLRWKYSFF